MITYVVYQSFHNKSPNKYCVSFLRKSLHTLSTVLFLPIFSMFISVLYCDNRQNVIIKNLTCFSGSYYIHSTICLFFGIYFLCFSLIVKCLYFDTKMSSKNPMGTLSSCLDVHFLIIKCLLVILFCIFTKEVNGNQWIIIILMLLFSGFLLFSLYEKQPFYRKIVNNFYKCIFFIYGWSNFLLFLAKIFENSSFNGSLVLFPIGVLIITLIIFTNNKRNIEVLINTINKAKNGENYLIAINIFKELIEKREVDRNAKIVLDGYIEQIEEHCLLKDCAFKKYLKSISESKIDATVFLLQYCETMYQNAISKFPLCNSIRISYSFFLIDKLNKKKKAFTELSNAEQRLPSFEHQFIIYRYKKIIEEETNDVSDKDDDLDFVTNLEYKNHFVHFKGAIVKASILYLDFWSLLLSPNQDSQEDLSKLNDYGAKINILVEEINSRFEKMQKLKHNDKEGLKYYSDFLNDILNDKEKAKKLQRQLNEIDETKLISEEVNIMNLDLNCLSSNNEFQYIVCSAHSKNTGMITNVSLGIYIMFGFTKSELVGKNVDILIPEIFHKEHNEILVDLINDFKKTSIDITEIKKYKPTFCNISTYGRNKSRYLVPINLQNTIIPTENNDNVLISKVAPFLLSLSSSTSPNCVVITNNSLLIQNFTPNAMNLLGMSSRVMNSAVDITEYIKQFSEDFLKYVVDNEEITLDQKLLLKQTILMKKFKSPMLINWKLNEFCDLKHKLQKNNTDNVNYDLEEVSSPIHRTYATFAGSSIDNSFILTVEEATIRKKKVGYIFKFEKMEKDHNSFRNSVFYGKNFSTDKLQLVKKNSPVKIEESQKRNISGKVGTLIQDNNQGDFCHNIFHSSTIVEKNYIPDSNLKFTLDPISLSYKTSIEHKKEELEEYLKNKALHKIRLVQEQKSSNHESETSECQSSEVSDELSDSDSQSLEFLSSSKEISDNNSSTDPKHLIPSAPNLLKHDSKIKTGNNSNQYYKVNFTKIKFILYNFKKNAFLEVEKWDKRDQVEIVTSNEPKREYIQELTTDDSMNKTPGNNISEIPNPTFEQDLESQHKALVNQIEYALQKQETQPSITKMKWVSFFVFLLLMSGGVAILVIIIITLNHIEENIKLVRYSLYLLFLNTYEAYYIRELTLLNNENYTQIPYNRSYYTTKCYNNALEFFTRSNEYLTNLLTTHLSLSKENEFKLNNSTVNATIIQDDYNITKFNITMTSAFVELNTALFQICHIDIDNFVATNRDVFYFLYNSLNDVAVGMEKQVEVYIDQMKINVKNAKLYYGFILCGIAFTFVIIFYFMSHAYDGVAKRKESYLQVFFEIGNSVIKASLEKCENFTKKIQAESVSDYLSSDSGDDLSEENIVIEKPNTSKEKTRKFQKSNISKDTKIFRIKLVICLFLIGVFSLLLYLFYWRHIDNLFIYLLFYRNFVELVNTYIMLFNGLREYMFEPEGTIMYMKASEYLSQSLENIYIVRKNKQAV